jgi:hypothetical protein
MEAMAERMGHDLVRHHPTMPSVSKTPQAVNTTCRFEDSLHFLHDNKTIPSVQLKAGVKSGTVPLRVFFCCHTQDV